jgi:hypothetical protein
MPEIKLRAGDVHAAYVALKRLQGVDGTPVRAPGALKLKMARLAAALFPEAKSFEETVTELAKEYEKAPATFDVEQRRVADAEIDVRVPALLTEKEISLLAEVPNSLEPLLPFIAP